MKENLPRALAARNYKSAFVIIYDAFSWGDGMPLRSEWEEKAANLLKAEIKRRGLTYAQVVEKLAEVGVLESERNVRNKVSRGKFTAAFLLQCLSAIGSQEFRL
ncbi:DUF6471 domain-containing protein [Hyphomonas sp.]|uniref:DUF6471 domain-containing protein n=1 Tax=Hyphomonas sp. TaxID=87 RepID=UPI0025B7BCA4|nr:DUF6471 domain-containing protein [Hyphomonas sp.]